MPDKSIIKSIKKYLRELKTTGIPVEYGILFGSYARGRNIDKWSDIDLLIVSEYFDTTYSREDITNLWRIAACGQQN